MKASLQKILSVVLCIVLCIGIFPISALAEEEILADVVTEETEPPVAEEEPLSLDAGITASGVCGANLTWTLTDDGALTISGSGEMYDYFYCPLPPDDPTNQLGPVDPVIIQTPFQIDAAAECSPWYRNSAVKSVTIESGVTSIGASAFIGCSNLTAVTIPSSVTKIGDSAFEYCSSLANVVYQGNRMQWLAVNIGSSNNPLLAANIYFTDPAPASGKCGENLTWVFTGDGTLTISGTGAMFNYSYCPPLPPETIGDDYPVFEPGYIQLDLAAEYPPWNASGAVKTVILENGVTSVCVGAFCGCTNLAKITLPASLTSISNYAFADCPHVTDIYFGGTQAQWETLSKGSDNTALTSAAIHYGSAPSVETDVEVSVSNVSALAGSEIVVPVTINHNPGIAGFSLTFSYDSELLTLLSFTPGEVLGSDSVSTNGNIVNWMSSTGDNVYGTGTILNLCFKVSDSAEDGNTAITAALTGGKPSNFSNENSEAVPVLMKSGTVSISTGVLGDVTGDDDVTIADVVKLNRVVLGKTTLSEKEMKLGDVAFDGDITMADVIKVNRFVLGKIASLED